MQMNSGFRTPKNQFIYFFLFLKEKGNVHGFHTCHGMEVTDKVAVVIYMQERERERDL